MAHLEHTGETSLTRIGEPARRRIIVHIATSADGYIARPDGDMDWLTNRRAPKGFYGIPAFERSIDTKLLGRKTFDVSLSLGAAFGGRTRNFVFSRQPPPASVPPGVEFVTESIARFADRLRQGRGKNVMVWCRCTTTSCAMERLRDFSGLCGRT